MTSIIISSILIIGALAWSMLFKTSFNSDFIVWAGHRWIESDVVVDGSNTLIIDAAIIHNTGHHDIIVEDSANVTIVNGVKKVDNASEIRIVCRDSSKILVSNSTIDMIRVGYGGVNLTIESDAYVNSLLMKYPAKLRVIDSDIGLLEAPLTITGNFSAVGDTFSGAYDSGVEVLGDSIIGYQVYQTTIWGSGTVVFDNPTARMFVCNVHDSARLFLNNLVYSDWQNYYGYYGLGLTCYDQTNVTISNSTLGFYSYIILRHHSYTEVSNSTIGKIYASEYSNFTASHLGLDIGYGGPYLTTSEFHGHSTARIVNSNETRILWVGNTGQTYFGLGQKIDVYDQAIVIVENVTIGGVFYHSKILTAE